jgi:hypothetical protein
MKLFRGATANTVIRNHFTDVANSQGAIVRQAAREQRAREHRRGRRFEGYRTARETQTTRMWHSERMGRGPVLSLSRLNYRLAPQLPFSK